MLKRLLAICLVLILSLTLVVGCRPAKKPSPPAPPRKTAPKIVPRASALQDPPAPPLVIDKAGSQFAMKVVQLVNIERQKVGHDPLAEDKLLDKGAAAKAADMKNKNYFGHTSPTYGSPFKMMKRFGVHYQKAGENIASGYKTPEAVVSGWMKSSGHRANILSTKYGKTGVGYAKGGKSGAYWVEWFTN